MWRWPGNDKGQVSFSVDASQGLTELRLGVDVGGTFTDLALMDDAGNVTVAKTPSTPRNLAQVSHLRKW
jgi:hypothetical protein